MALLVVAQLALSGFLSPARAEIASAVPAAVPAAPVPDGGATPAALPTGPVDYAYDAAGQLRGVTQSSAGGQSARYDYDKPDGISWDELNDRFREIDREFHGKFQRAAKDRIDAIADANKDWVHTLTALNKQLVTDLANAQKARANKAKNEIVSLAQAVSDAQRVYEIAQANAGRNQRLRSSASRFHRSILRP